MTKDSDDSTLGPGDVKQPAPAKNPSPSKDTGKD